MDFDRSREEASPHTRLRGKLENANPNLFRLFIGSWYKFLGLATNSCGLYKRKVTV